MKARDVFFGSDDLTAGQERIRELLMYPFAGIFTALANFIAFVIMDLILKDPINIDLFGLNYDLGLIAKQFVSWVATILTAYVTNSIFVFRNRSGHLKKLLAFAAGRLSTFFLIEVALFSFMVYFAENVAQLPQGTVIFSIFGFNCTCLYVIKVLNNIILIVMNFLVSKWLVFRTVAQDSPKNRKAKNG